MRRSVVAISSLVLIFSGLGISPANAVADGSYPCGTSGSFTVDTGVVTTHSSCIGVVVIPEGITKIADYAFQNNSALTEVYLPASVISIEVGAFADTTSLTKIDFTEPSLLVTIGDAAFQNSGVTSVVIPEGVTGIGINAFRNTVGLESVVIPESVTSIGTWAFLNSGLKTVTFADGARPLTIADAAFQNSELINFSLPARVTTVGSYVFAESNNLSTFEFESGSNLTSLGQDSFRGARIASMILPSSLTTIGANAFKGSGLDYVEIPATVTSIGANAFADLYAVQFYFHGAAPVAESSSFSSSTGQPLYASSLANLATFSTPPTSWNGLSTAGLFYEVNYESNGGTAVDSGNFGRASEYYQGWFNEVVGVEPKAPTKSGALFAGWSANDGGQRIEFPYSPGVSRDITLYAKWLTPFDAATGDGYVNCSTSGIFTIADNVVTESESCRGTAVIPDSVTEIFEGAFEESRLTAVSFGAGSNLKYIGDYAFDGSSLASITIPVGVTAIGYNSFSDTSSLTAVTFAAGSQLKLIGEGAFRYSAIEAIEIPAGVTHILRSTFYAASDLAVVTFAANSKISYIGEEAFYEVEELAAIEIPASVTAIDNSAFENANDLVRITFAPGSKLSYLGEQAFYNTAITSIQIPAGVTYLSRRLFRSTDNLVNIYFLGNAPSVTANQFEDLGANPKAFIKSTATGFPAVNSLWHGLTVEIGVYDVAFNSHGGSAIASDAFATGGLLAAPASPTRAGFTFSGWSATNAGSAIAFPYSPGVTSNITLFANWTLNTATSSVESATNPSRSVSVSFPARSKALTKAHKAALKKSVTTSGKDATYVVTGTAGLLPGVTAAQAKTLAKARANAVKAYLVKLGVFKANITVKTKVTNQGIAPKTKTLASYLTS
jgi:uncharacterized repeat protein (TIGR02543 family)